MQNGPRLIAPSADGWKPPNYQELMKKPTAKTFVAMIPLELFAYSAHDDLATEASVIPKIIECIGMHLPASAFRGVRVLDLFRLRQVDVTSK